MVARPCRPTCGGIGVKPVYQTIFEPPLGNCLQAAVASVLELQLEEVPNFAEAGDKWWDAYSGFLQERGLYPLMLEPGPNAEFHGYHLIVGKSPRFDCDHVVVGRDGVPIHDPRPDGNCQLEDPQYVEVFVSTMEHHATQDR